MGACPCIFAKNSENPPKNEAVEGFLLKKRIRGYTSTGTVGIWTPDSYMTRTVPILLSLKGISTRDLHYTVIAFAKENMGCSKSGNRFTLRSSKFTVFLIGETLQMAQLRRNIYGARHLITSNFAKIAQVFKE